LHASIQCDIRNVEKAKFLGDVGFSELVQTRELMIEQIREIRAQVDTPLEYIIHCVLCVAFSSRCYILHAARTQRHSRRLLPGPPPLIRRLTYCLGDVMAYHNKHLLSTKNNGQSRNLEALTDAGIRSFKIEGRYKDMC
jgi:collagenase-like PrtC family protease